MAKVTTTLIHDGTKGWCTVELTVIRSLDVKLKSYLAESPKGMMLPDGTQRHASAVEAACFSGTLFALRNIGDEGYAVAIDSVFGEINSGDLTVCAIAAGVGLAYGTEHPEIVTEDTLQGWRLSECQVTEVPIA